MDGSVTKTLTATGIAAIGLGPLDAVSFSLFGATSTTLFMALVGAAISFAYNEGEDAPPLPKKRMYFLILANTLVSTAAVSVLPGLLGWEWYSTKIEGSVALLLAVSARFTIPLFVKTLPELIRKWFRIGEYNTNKGDGNENI